LLLPATMSTALFCTNPIPASAPGLIDGEGLLMISPGSVSSARLESNLPLPQPK